MTIKTKLRAGQLFLFAVIVLIGVLGGVFIYRISDESKMIIKDNYETIVYTKAMTEACDRLQSGKEETAAIDSFGVNLKKQLKNITEPGEGELTRQLEATFSRAAADSGTARLDDLFAVRQLLHRIEQVNLDAIRNKNDRAGETAGRVILWMSLIGSIAIIIAFSFVVNFPGYIANPIRELTAGIKEIAARNYSKRLHFKRTDEFGELATAFNSMTEKLEEYESSSLAKLLFEKKRLDTVISSMRDAIIGLDENGRILFLNPVATQLLGVKEGVLPGKLAAEAAVSNDLLRELLRDLGQENESAPKPPLKIFADGRESYFNKEVLRVTAIATGETESRHIGFVVLLKNITQFRELDLAKTNFIATVSHELKTPIAAIKMSLNLLENQRVGELNEEQEKLVNYIRDESNRLLNITAELLDMAQVETGKITLDIRPVNPQEIVDYARKAVAAQAQEKQVLLEVQMAEALPVVNADAEKSAWVLINLLANAIRYAPEQSRVTIRISQGAQGILFSVKDEGKGIPAEYQERIFDKYFRAPGAKAGGTGLGLAIAREFIESQKGTIGLRSVAGEGAEFWFTLPV